jgi:hypothetical protein
MTFGMREEYTAKMRLSPPSTGSRYTMSVLVRFVGGRASAMLSIFATITRPRALTGSPVNGTAAALEPRYADPADASSGQDAPYT